MSSRPMPTASKMLREIANSRTEEFQRFKDRFTEDVIFSLNKAYDQQEARDAILARLANLLGRVEVYEPHGIVNDDFAMWTRRVKKAQHDKSISSGKLIATEKSLHHHLEAFASRLVMTEYHIALMENALQTLDANANVGTILDKVSLDDEFELIEEDVESVYTAFEKHTFSKKSIDAKAIEGYLAGLFDNAFENKQLQLLRQRMLDYGNDVLSGKDEVDVEFTEWCIKDLLMNGLLGTEKQAKLQGYLQSRAGIRALTAMLNSKSIRHWSWRNGEEGLPVVAQKNAKGNYCITVEEDIIDMLFLHTLAMRWGIELKDGLESLFSTRAGDANPTSEELQKREYYLQGPRRHQPSPCTTCDMPTQPNFVMPHSRRTPPQTPPPPMFPPYQPANQRRQGSMMPPPMRPPMPPPPMPPPSSFTPQTRRSRRTMRAHLPPPGPSMCIDDERRTLYMQNFFLSRLSDPEAERPSDTEKDAALLKMLALDIKTREALDGSIHGIRTNFRSFASTLPHETISAVLGYIGVSEEWLGIFNRFLCAPLNMGPVVLGTSDKVRARTSGVPIGHGFERFFGEAVLFFLDLAVRNRTASEQTTPYLLRLRDECYFVGKQQQCEQVRQQIETFANVMGLDVNVKDLFPPASSPVSAIGLIAFKRTALRDFERPSKVVLSIDKARVAAYAGRVKKQLAACPTVFAWVSLWNRTIGTYAPHLFGPLVNVFGQPHLEAVNAAYSLIYEVIFGSDCSLTQHVINLLPVPLPPGEPSFSTEAWIHLPAAYGGLGIHNPHAWLNYDRRNLLVDPETPWKDYLEREKAYYNEVSARFYELTTKQREEKLNVIFDGDEDRIADVFGSKWKETTTTFPTLEELTANRERRPHQVYRSIYPPPPNHPYNHPYNSSPPLAPPPDPLSPYQILSSPPLPSGYRDSVKALGDARRLSGKLGVKDWEQLTIQDKWALELYGEECLGRFGGVDIWYRDGVPGELLEVLGGEEYAREM